MKAIFGKLYTSRVPFLTTWADGSIVVARSLWAADVTLSRLVGETINRETDVVIFKTAEGSHTDMLNHIDKWEGIMSHPKAPRWFQVGGQLHSVEVTKKSNEGVFHSFRIFTNRDGKDFIVPVKHENNREITRFFVEFKTSSEISVPQQKTNELIISVRK